MKINKKLLIIITIALLITAALPALAIETGLEATADAAGLKQAPLPTVIGTIIGYALSFIGIIFLLLMIYGGILWMTSYGNEQKVTKAKDLIIGAVIGLVIVLAAYAITNFIVGAVTGAAGTK